MQLSDLNIDQSYAYYPGASKFEDKSKIAHYVKRVIFKERTTDGKACVVETSSEWNDYGVYINLNPADLFLTWTDWKQQEAAYGEQKALEHEQWRKDMETDQDFADKMEQRLSAVGIDAKAPNYARGEKTFSLTAMQLNDLIFEARDGC